MAAVSDQKFGYTRRKAAQVVTFCVKEERNASFRKVTSILQKPEIDRTDEEKAVLCSCADLVKEVNQRIAKRRKVKDRLLEVQDDPDVLEQKCIALAEALANSRHLVVYTGAGISTSACIPDYRGTNGIWTLLQQGKDIGRHDLTLAEPTRTHMALAELHRAGLLRHVVSQNCDGLHLRSGLPKSALSEVHGNMYIEVCAGCQREYWRLFDVTEHTGRYTHRTMRRCYSCSAPLADTIVHFGERGSLRWPLNWVGASTAADAADTILCIGSSLKVLKKYPWLWGMDKPAKKRPRLYIVNLQWTPKDDQAVLKINGRCDEVMDRVMHHLRLPMPTYRRDLDPMFHHASDLHPLEMHTTSQPNLKLPGEEKPDPVEFDTKCIVSEQTDRVESDKCVAKDEPCEVKLDPVIARETFPSETVIFQPSCIGFSNVFDAYNGFFSPMFSLPVPVFMVSRAFQLDHNYSKTLQTILANEETKKAIEVAPPPLATKDTESCSFCIANYESAQCLYYARRESVFSVVLTATTVVCECCDDEDLEGEPGAEPAVAEDDVADKVARVPVVNPGWYGKGCRKRGRKKR